MLWGTAEESHCFSTVIVTGMEKVAPWHPFDDDAFIDAEFARSMVWVLPFTAVIGVLPVQLVNVTPVVVQLLKWLASGVMVPPF